MRPAWHQLQARILPRGALQAPARICDGARALAPTARKSRLAHRAAPSSAALDAAQLAATVVAAVLGLLSEQTEAGRAVGGTLVAFGSRALLAEALPSLAGTAEEVVDGALPLALAFTVVAAQADSTGGRAAQGQGRQAALTLLRVLLAFGLGAVGAFAGGAAAFRFVGLGAEGARAASCIAATYIGGSVNFFATARLVGLPASTLGAIAAADIALMGLYFAVLASIHRIKQKRGRGTVDDWKAMPQEQQQRLPGVRGAVSRRFLQVQAAFLSVAAVTGALWLGGPLERSVFRFPGGGTAAVTFAAWLAGLVVRKTRLDHSSAVTSFSRESASFLMLIFFAAVGAQARLGELLANSLSVFTFAAFSLVVHGIVMLAGAPLLNALVLKRLPGRQLGTLSVEEVLVASNANVGGAATAAAFAGATIKRPDLVLPATFSGIVGYGVGTTAGVLLFRLLSV